MLANILVPVLALASTGLAYPAHVVETRTIQKRADLAAPVSQFKNEGYCLVDNAGGKRLLKEYYTNNLMTLELCAEHCLSLGRDYDLAGVEYGVECFCDKALEVQAKGFSLTEDCTFLCPGNNQQICGGSNAISAVTIQSFPGRPNPPYDPTFVYCPSGGCVKPPTAPIPAAVPAPSASTINGFTTDGKCVKEIDGRLLKGPSFTNPLMTQGMCVDFCRDKGFFAAGVEFGVECFCGDKGQAAAAGVSTECNRACPGSPSTQNCGGPNALVIFDSDASPPAPVDPRTPIFLAPPLDQWRDSRYCLVDNAGGKRLLSNQLVRADMDHETCVTHCMSLNQGFDLAAVEYGTECYCGIINEVIAKGYSLSNDCTFKCPGDSAQKCGGPDALTALISRDVGLVPIGPYDPNFVFCPSGGCPVAPVLQDKYAVVPVKGRPDWNYSGYCVRDNLNGPVFSDRKDIPGATQALCIAHCEGLNKGYDVAGIEYGVECSCAKSDLFTGGGFRLTTMCDFSCPGEPTERCGGPNALTALTIGTISLNGGPPLPGNPVYFD